MYILRNFYLQKLIDSQDNGLVKVICGLRRCGKSFLLFKLFHDYLVEHGTTEEHIISLALDEDVNEPYRIPGNLSSYLRSKVGNTREKYYIFLDEVQFAISKEELVNHDKPVQLYSVLNGLLHLGNVDIYVTGSNSKMLARDILTEFRGRSDIINLHPLSFKEFYEFVGGDRSMAFEEYALYGGMPAVLLKKDDLAKTDYLTGLFEEVFFKDVLERYSIALPNVLAEITNLLCSAIGSLTNVSKITNTLASIRKLKINNETIASYMEYLTDAYLFRRSERYDIKVKRYFEYPSKYYCADLGLRNARLNWRQQEESHILENIIYNELISRGYRVDVGVVNLIEKDAVGQRHQKSCEIDFVVNRGMKKYYIQSTLALSDEDKIHQEVRPLLAVRDMFRKIVISKTNARPWLDDNGILHLNIYDFLLQENSIDF